MQKQQPSNAVEIQWLGNQGGASIERRVENDKKIGVVEIEGLNGCKYPVFIKSEHGSWYFDPTTGETVAAEKVDAEQPESDSKEEFKRFFSIGYKDARLSRETGKDYFKDQDVCGNGAALHFTTEQYKSYVRGWNWGIKEVRNNDAE